MKHITKIILRVESTSSCSPQETRIAHLINPGNPSSIKAQWAHEPSTYTVYIHYQMWSPIDMRIVYEDGDDKVIIFNVNQPLHKRWRKVNTTVRKKFLQNTLLEFSDVNTDNYSYLSKGIGDRYKWLVKNEDIYHPAIETIVEENFHHARAVCIGPGSRIDMLLQKAYYAKRPTAKKGHTNEQKITTK